MLGRYDIIGSIASLHQVELVKLVYKCVVKVRADNRGSMVFVSLFVVNGSYSRITVQWSGK